MLHIALHFLIPAMVALLCFRSCWRSSYVLMLATMVVDLDHLLATPIYDPGRCSIGFHPLHQALPILVYFLLCFVPRFRLIGIGLLIHMALDSMDCYANNNIWFVSW